MDRTEDSIIVHSNAMGMRSKRRRLETPSGSQSPAAAGQGDQNLSAVQDEAQIPPYDPAEPVEVALKRLKAWMKSGALHDKVCFTCGLPGDLIGCGTCQLAFHESCKPCAGRVSPISGAWFCHICVRWNWHVEPPSLALSSAEPRPEQHRPLSRQRTSPPPPVRKRANKPEPSREHESAKPARKSRYSTLSTDVENALRILYTEVESTGDLRQQIDHLTADVARLQRELNLGKVELDLARKMTERLRQESVQAQTAVAEVATLRREKQEAEDKLKDSQAQMENMKATMHEWKRSLSRLVAE